MADKSWVLNNTKLISTQPKMSFRYKRVWMVAWFRQKIVPKSRSASFHVSCRGFGVRRALWKQVLKTWKNYVKLKSRRVFWAQNIMWKRSPVIFGVESKILREIVVSPFFEDQWWKNYVKEKSRRVWGAIKMLCQIVKSWFCHSLRVNDGKNYVKPRFRRVWDGPKILCENEVLTELKSWQVWGKLKILREIVVSSFFEDQWCKEFRENEVPTSLRWKNITWKGP